MDILIVGLGLIGGAYARRLKAKGNTIYAFDNNEDTIKYALENNYVNYASTNMHNYIDKVQIIIICLYPRQIINFLEDYQDSFNKNQIITDVCGIKESFLDKAQSIVKNAEYLSHHPMAGKEKKGIQYSGLVNFSDANFLITPTTKNSKEAVGTLRMLAEELEFKNIFVISPAEHDQMIAYTSQLTHAIAVSLVCADRSEDTKKFIGDSYRDLTRIAKINSPLWSELFLENKANLLSEISNFKSEITKIEDALKENGEEKLIELFQKSKRIRGEMEK